MVVHPLEWDGHQPATEPGNPDIVYAERQEGHLPRIDRATGEVVDIQPQPAAGEGPERIPARRTLTIAGARRLSSITIKTGAANLPDRDKVGRPATSDYRFQPRSEP